jgi:hypothetical protein
VVLGGESKEGCDLENDRTAREEKRYLPTCYSELVWFRFTALVLGTEIELPSLARVFSGCGETGGNASAQRRD